MNYLLDWYVCLQTPLRPEIAFVMKKKPYMQQTGICFCAKQETIRITYNKYNLIDCPDSLHSPSQCLKAFSLKTCMYTRAIFYTL